LEYQQQNEELIIT